MDEREEKNLPAETEETNKKKRRSRKGDTILTKESFCAVFGLFSLIAFFILVTKGLVLGEPGEYIHALLTGIFGYCAYPLTLVAAYNCVMGFLGKKLIKKRTALAMIITTITLGVLVAQTVQTCFIWEWENEGYLAACFNSGDAFPATAIGGWVGGLVVALFSVLTTKIGALVILSALTLLCLYVSVKVCVSKKSKDAKNGTENAEGGQAVEPVTTPNEPVYPAQQGGYYNVPQGNEMGAGQAPMGAPNAYNADVQSQNNYNDGVQAAGVASQTPVEPMPGYSESGVSAQNMGGYAPYVPYTVRQRPGFTLPNDNSQQAPMQSQQAQPQGDVRIYSPFGAATPMQQPGQALTPEETRRILFGSTPKQNYEDNLIFDGNSNANRRPSATYEAPSVPPTYSQQYQNAVENSTPNRPQKIVGETGANFGRTPSSNPYGLDVPNAGVQGRDSYSAQNAPTGNMPSAFDANVGGYGTQERRMPPNDGVIGRGVDVSRGEPTRSESIYDGYGLGRGVNVETDVRRTSGLDAARNIPVTPAEPPVSETTSTPSGRRHEYMDTFSLNNPNIFGQAGNRVGSRDEEVAATDRSTIFEEEPPVAPATNNARGNDDPYSLRSFDEEPAPRAAVTNEFAESDNVAGMSSRRERTLPSQEGPVASVRPVESTPAPAPAPTPAPTPTPVPPVEKKEEPAPEPKKPRIHKPYVRVPLHYFNCSDNLPDSDATEVEDIKRRIVETLEDYNVSGGTIASVTFGPTVTRYNVVLPRGVSPRKVVSLEQEIAMGLCREGVNVYPNVEDGAVSIEVPNKNRQTVELGCMFIDDAYTKAKPTSLVFAMGKDIANRKVYGDVCKMTHLLVAGSSGSGKSVFLGCLIISLITKYSPDEMRLILIDPKKTEFVLYNNLPHLMVNEIITDCKKAVQSLSWAIGEMERRYTLIEKKSLSGTYVVNIDEYNANLEPGEEKLPKIVIIVDELADLMLNAKKDMEDKIQSLTQKARAAGIHLILATQRPSTDVITGVIKSNLPTRIAFTVATDVDSRVILDQTGAQKLLGKGDMVYTASGINTPVRVQSPFISSSDSQKVVNFIKENNEAYFDEAASTFINNARSSGGESGGNAANAEVEPVYLEALKLVIQTQTASISMLQRKCNVGFNKAGKIIEWMEALEYISPYEGAKARRVLITQERFVEIYGEW